MKRKIVRHGPSTLTISLPSKWCKQFSLKSGDEINIINDGNMLILDAQSEHKGDNYILEMTPLKKAIRAKVGMLYKLGYDEIKVFMKSSEDFEFLHSLMNEGFIGFEIIEEKKDYVIIKKVSELDYKEFDNMLRRLFLVLIEMGKELEDAKEEDSLKRIILMEKTTNKFADFCRRALNKKIITNLKRNSLHYYLVEELEKIGDGYKDIAVSMLQQEFKKTKTMVKCNSYFRDCYELYYNFSMEKLESFIKRKKELQKDIQTDSELVSVYLYGLTENIANLKGVLVGLSI